MGLAHQSAWESQDTPRAWPTVVFWLATWSIASVVALILPHDPGTAALVVWTVLVAFLCVVRPAIGLYFLVAAALLVEQNDPTNGVAFFNTRFPFFWDSSSFSRLAIPITPAEILICCLFVGWAARVIRTGGGTGAWRNHLIWPAVFLAATLIVGALHGFMTGGDIKVALWEIRGPSYLLTLVFLVPGVVERRSQLKVLVWIIIVGVVWAAAEGLWVAGVVLNWDLARVETLVGHDDAVHIAVMLVLLAALVTIGGDRLQRAVLLVSSPVLVGVLLATRRRDAIVALGLGLGILVVIRLRERPGDVLRFGAILGVVVVLAAGLALTASGRQLLDQPIRALTSAFSPATARDSASNQYREAERRGLRATIKRAPLLGIGFGQQYDVPGDVFYIGVPMYRYITHDDLLRFWAKAGTIGFVGYWLLNGAAVLEGARLYRKLSDPWLKTIAAFAACVVAMQVTVHSVDMAMTFYRSMILVGVVIGMMLTLERIQRRELAAR